MSWPVGTIVVCVDDKLGAYDRMVIGLPLIRGSRYTVREYVSAVTFSDGDVAPGILLMENVRVNGAHFDSEWWAPRFRLAEGGACESERARQMSEVRV